jgi:hypothetical protein
VPDVDGGTGNSKFMATEVATSPIAVTRTISGLILTPSVSSSKNLSSPALDAGIGAFFFLPLKVVLPCGANTHLKCVVQ